MGFELYPVIRHRLVAVVRKQLPDSCLDSSHLVMRMLRGQQLGQLSGTMVDGMGFRGGSDRTMVDVTGVPWRRFLGQWWSDGVPWQHFSGQ